MKVPVQPVTEAERDLKVNRKLDTQPPKKKSMPKPVNIKQKRVPKKQEKPKAAATAPAKVVKRLPGEEKGYHKSWDWVWTQKLNWLKKKRHAFAVTWSHFRKANPDVTAKNLNVAYKHATKKDLLKEVEHSPAAQWETKFRRAMKAITKFYK